MGFFYKKLLERLENANMDGSFLIPRGGDGGILVEGLGQTGFDVSMKSEPWRRGYYEALMGAARVAENPKSLVWQFPMSGAQSRLTQGCLKNFLCFAWIAQHQKTKAIKLR